MSFHKHPRNDVVTPAGQFKPDVTLADYIARKTKEPLTFEQWFRGYLGCDWEDWDNNLQDYDMRAAWNASRENM